MKIPRYAGWIAVAVAGVFLLASLYVAEMQEDISNTMQLRIAEQTQTLTAIAEITDRNGADNVAEQIIRDCASASRARFETLLNELGTLSLTELNEIEPLFEACGSFFAERKAIMVARMEREFEIYRDYVDLYEKLDSRAALTQYPVAVWEELVALEKQRRDILEEQVEIQGTIITALRSARSDSEEIQTQLVRAQQIAQSASTLNRRIDEVRQELTDI